MAVTNIERPESNRGRGKQRGALAIIPLRMPVQIRLSSTLRACTRVLVHVRGGHQISLNFISTRISIKKRGLDWPQRRGKLEFVTPVSRTHLGPLHLAIFAFDKSPRNMSLPTHTRSRHAWRASETRAENLALVGPTISSKSLTDPLSLTHTSPTLIQSSGKTIFPPLTLRQHNTQSRSALTHCHSLSQTTAKPPAAQKTAQKHRD
jgi:hypothetical protein